MAKTFKTSGEETKRMSILLFLASKGKPTTKEEIIKAVWGKNRNDFNDFYPVARYDRITGERLCNDDYILINNMRGWASGTFSEMVKDERLHYNKHTRKWSLGNRGWEAIAKYHIAKNKNIKTMPVNGY